MLTRSRSVPDDYPAFRNLPARLLTVGSADEQIALHVSGTPSPGRIPLVCIAGYQRNMADFSDFASRFRAGIAEDWPIVMIDLKGRGRSSDRTDKSQYISTVDAADVRQCLAALALPNAIFVGQGYGGQVVMAIAAAMPTLFAGTILLDAGPASDPRGLIRLRNNLRDLEGGRSEAGFRVMLRRMVSADYPSAPDGLLDSLGARTHYLDGRQRVRTLFDPHLVTMLEAFEHDDVLIPQWPLYDALSAAPLLVMRTQLTEQLRRETMEEMLRRRRDAAGYLIEGQASPALLNTAEDIGPIVDFVRRVAKSRRAA